MSDQTSPSLIPGSTPADSTSPAGGAGVSRRALLVAAPAVALAGGGLVRERSADAAVTATRAAQADHVADMVGVAIDTHEQTGVYSRRATILSRLREVRIRYIRDRLNVDDAYQTSYLRDLAAIGIRFNLVMGDPNYSRGTPERLVQIAASRWADRTVTFEGANEWDLRGPEGGWPAEVREHQRRLYRAAKSDARVRRIPVLGPSLGRRYHYDELGDLTPVLDQGNLHLYQGGYVPNYRAAVQLDKIRRVSGDKPVTITESGWHNATDDLPSGHNYTPEEVAAVYAPRVYAEYFRTRVRKVYLHQLCDDKPDPDSNDYQAHFGLLRYDMSRKPLFYSLKNFLGLVSDPGPGFSPGALAYGVQGPSDLRQLLLQRRNGTYLLLLWRHVAIWDPENRRYPVVSQRDVTVSCPAATQVRAFRPAGSGEPSTPGGTPRRAELQLGGELVVLEIRTA